MFEGWSPIDKNPSLAIAYKWLSGGINLKLTYAIFACGLASFICLSGCTVQKEWAATGGSRADGTVELAFEYGGFEKPQVNNAQGVDLAASMCSGWGYTGSQPFTPMSKCEAVNAYGNCLRFLVTRKYQCLGAPASPAALQREPVALAPVETAAPAQPQTNLQPAVRHAVPVVDPEVNDQWDASDHPQ